MKHCILGSALVIALCVLSCLVDISQAQTANATTDPSEG
jgi:hypothetical protein